MDTISVCTFAFPVTGYIHEQPSTYASSLYRVTDYQPPWRNPLKIWACDYCGSRQYIDATVPGLLSCQSCGAGLKEETAGA